MKFLRRLTLLSTIKFMVLIALYYGFVWCVDNISLDTTNSLLLDINEIIEELFAKDFTFFGETRNFSYFYDLAEQYLLYLLVFGAILNIFAFIFLPRNKYKSFTIVIGFIKIFTLAPITGICIFLSPVKVEPTGVYDNKKSILDLSKKDNYNNNDNRPVTPKKPNVVKEIYSKRSYPTPKIALSSILSSLFIIVFISSGISFSSNFGFEWFNILLLVIMIIGVLSNTFGYANKKRLLKKGCSYIKYGMTLADVKYILQNIPLSKSGYDHSNRYVLQYRISSGRQYELKIFIFEDNLLVEKDEAYRRITTTTTYY